MNNDFVKLVCFKRNFLDERMHYGCIFHLNKSGIISKTGNCENVKFYQRSCSKPLQFSTLINFDIDKKFNFTPEEIAVCCASHTGTKEHQKHILNILSKLGLKEDDLLCPPDLPLDKEEQMFLIRNSLSPQKVHNNCSGKHAAMLALCINNGFDISDYNDLSHPVSSLVINQICNLCGVKIDDVIISKDGCTLPTVATTLPELGKGFLNLFLSEKYKQITSSVLQFPYLAGGKDRIDSEIINAGSGNLIAKVGAEGIIVVVNIEREEALCVKIADSNYLARSLVIIKSMIDIGWLREDNIFSTPLNELYKTKIETELGERVGNAEFCFSLK